MNFWTSKISHFSHFFQKIFFGRIQSHFDFSFTSFSFFKKRTKLWNYGCFFSKTLTFSTMGNKPTFGRRHFFLKFSTFPRKRLLNDRKFDHLNIPKISSPPICLPEENKKNEGLRFGLIIWGQKGFSMSAHIIWRKKFLSICHKAHILYRRIICFYLIRMAMRSDGGGSHFGALVNPRTQSAPSRLISDQPTTFKVP